MRIVETDNFGSDYPDESFVNIPDRLGKADAIMICDIINQSLPEDYNRFYKVVDNDYKLQPGFEP